MATTIRKDDYGTVITLTVNDGLGSPVDISAATAKHIRLIPPANVAYPDGAPYRDFAATFTTDGTDGKIYYTLADGDIPYAGAWTMRAVITTASAKWHSTTAALTVQL